MATAAADDAANPDAAVAGGAEAPVAQDTAPEAADTATADAGSAPAPVESSEPAGVDVAGETAPPEAMAQAADTGAPLAAADTSAFQQDSLQQMSSLKARARKQEPSSLSAKESLKQTAANVLMQLSLDDDNKNAVRKAGGVKRLVSLLSSPDVEVQLNVLGALTNLALNEENKAEIRSLQAIPKIIALLDNKDENVQAKTVEVIWNLAGNDENRVAVLYGGGVQKLLDMLPATEEAMVRSTAVAASTLGALANLAAHPENQLAIREAGGVKKIVEIFTGAEFAKLKERAANCMENLALDRDNREEIRKLGGTAALVEDLISPRGEAATSGLAATSLIRAVAGTLKNLSVDEENKAEIARLEGVPVLVGFLKQSDTAVVGKSAECLGNFALEEEFRSKIRELGGVGMLLDLLDPAVADEVRLAAAGAILNLAVDDECKTSICQVQGMCKLVPLLEPSLDRKLRAVAAMTLTNLGAQDESALAIADAGGVTALVQCLAKPTDDILQEKAASALWNLSSVQSLKGSIRKAGGIEHMLSVLEFSTFVPAIENCLGTFLSLSETQENRFGIAQAGAVNLLIRLLDSEHSTVVEKTAGVIWNLAHEATVQHSVRQLDGLKPLIRLLSREWPLARFNAVGALPLLTEQEENVQEAFNLGVVPLLVNLLATETNVLMLQNAAQALGNIAEGNSSYQQEICEAQGLQRVIEVLARWSVDEVGADESSPTSPCSAASRQELLAKLCFAIWLICQKNDVNQAVFCELGGFSPLVRVLQPTNDETLLEMSAGACCALCEGCAVNKDRVREEQGLEPLIALLSHSCDSVKLNAAKALAHLAENGDNSRIIRHLGGLERLVHLLSP
jgi:hypothetical protein